MHNLLPIFLFKSNDSGLFFHAQTLNQMRALPEYTNASSTSPYELADHFNWCL